MSPMTGRLREWLAAFLLLLGFAGMHLGAANLPFHLPQHGSYREAGGVPNGVSGLIAAEVYVAGVRAPEATPFLPPSERVLGGAIHRVQAMAPSALYRTFGLLAVLLAAGIALCWVPRRERAGVALTLGALVLISGLASLRLSDGWDEFYINLKHAQNLIAHGTYSLNVSERIESTVDLVPFFTAGVVSRLTGVLPDDVAMLFGFLGNVLVITLTYAFVRRLTRCIVLALTSAAFAAVFPPLVFVGASGFMATLFAGCILGVLYLLLERRGVWSFRAYVLMGLLPLVRVEAVALGLLVWGFVLVGDAWRRRASLAEFQRWVRRCGPIHAWRLAAVFAPFVVLTAVRAWWFGFPIPVPVVFKNTGGDTGYLLRGAVQLRDYNRLFSLTPVLLVCAVPMALLLVRRGWRYVAAYTALTLFSLTYLIGGGDWFPGSWARYWLPLLAFTIVLASASLYAVLMRVRWPRPGWTLAVVLVSFALHERYVPRTAYNEVQEAIGASIDGWERVDNLARLGDFFRRTSETTWRVGSPEVATIMFFAERDVVGLIGIDNPDIARAPLTPMIVGDLLHRRRLPETLERRRPELLALFDPALTAPPYASLERTQAIGQELFMFERMQKIGYYRAGSYDYVQALGYHPFVVHDGGRVFMYWVHDAALATHRAKLATAGFSPRGTIHLRYDVPANLTSRFRPSGSGRFASLHAVRRPVSGAVVTTGSVRSGASVRSMPNAPSGPVYSTRSEAPNIRGAARFALDATTLGELRLPMLGGAMPGGVHVRLERRDNHALVLDVAVPQALPAGWHVLRINVSPSAQPLDLVVEDDGASVEQWFAVGAPWWMGEGVLDESPPAGTTSARAATGR